MLPHQPPERKFIAVSQIFSDDRIVEESVVRYGHRLHLVRGFRGCPPQESLTSWSPSCKVGFIPFQVCQSGPTRVSMGKGRDSLAVDVRGRERQSASVGSAAELLTLSVFPRPGRPPAVASFRGRGGDMIAL